MSKLIVVLDPGHTANYNKGVVAGFYEGNMTLDLAQRLKAELEKYGAKVYLTRTSGAQNPSLDARGKLAITKGATLFISLHSDASSSASTSWVTVIRSLKRPNSVELGQKLASAIAGLMGTKLSGYFGASGGVWTRKYPGYSTLDYYGVIRAAVVSGNVQDAFLIEHGFHTNPNDCAFLDSAACRAELAATEAKVIAEHYGLMASDSTAGLPTYKIGPVSRGDAERAIDLAKDMDVACMGTFEFGPVSHGDAARLQALAEEMDVLCTIAATDSAVSLSSYNVGPVSRGDAERMIVLAKDMDVACMGIFEFGPVSGGDAARLLALAKEIGVACIEM